jgi:cytoskeleton protein RodZ
LETIGERLKRERERRKISLDEISLSTKIGTRFLVAIEEGNFDQLPGGIFNKGFVKAYARSIGVDENLAVAEYELATAAAIPIPQIQEGSELTPLAAVLSVPEEDTGDGASRVPFEWFAVALLVFALGLAVWGFVSRERSARPAPALPPPPADRSSTPAPSLAAEVPAPAAVPQAADLPESKPEAPAVPAAPGSEAPNSVPDAGAFLVQIKARQDSWVSITADGRDVMQDTLAASSEKSVGARDQIVIKTGNVGALDISFNGKKLPAQGSDHRVKTLTFDSKGPKF